VLALADALAPVLDRLETRCRDDFAAHAERLEHRADAAGRERRIVEGHGDLHCRNICMTRPPTVYDALEFDLGLRALDLSAELAFLTMDLRYRGQASLASVFVESWRQAFALPDPDLDALLPTMERYRAMVRGKISAFLLADEEVDDEARAHAVDSLRQHVLLAVASAVGEDRTQSRSPLWIAVTGTPASGKSTLCRELARVSGGAWTWISTDRERKRLAGVAATRTLAAACYSEEWNERTYRAVLDAAASSRAPVCLLDGNYATAARRSVLTHRARAAGAELRLVWLHADEAVVRERLARRAEAPEESESDADVAVWQAACARAEVPDPSTAWHVATDAPETALRVARHLIADVGRPAG
jgi:predicted kinase